MKTLKFFTFILSIALIVSCFSSKQVSNSLKFTDKIEAPPGTVRISDSLFMDIYELTNVSYREMISYYKMKFGSDSYIMDYILSDYTPKKISSYDSVSSKVTYTLPYLTLPEYHNFPMVGLTYEQAVFYCEWRTDRVNEYYYTKENNIKTDSTTLYILSDLYDIPKKVKYRLPTKEEWEYAAIALIENKNSNYGYENFFNKKGLPNCVTAEYVNLTLNIENETDSLNFPKTEEVNFGKPNNYGLYNMIGNVSEMVSEKYLAKGLNYKDSLQNYNIFENIYYTEPSIWLGFRCICEIY